MKLSVKQMLVEFKDFAFKGNMIDLAVGVVIGTAFGTVIQSVVKNVVMPLVGMVPGLRGGYEKWHFGDVKVGLVLADLLNFTMVALAVFVVIVKLVGGIVKTTNQGMPALSVGHPDQSDQVRPLHGGAFWHRNRISYRHETAPHG